MDKIIVYTILIATLLYVAACHNEEYQMAGDHSLGHWADAIKHVEGENYGFSLSEGSPYALSMNKRKICMNTVRNKYNHWMAVQDQMFIYYLAEKYCPKNPDYWAQKVQYWLKKG